MSRMRDTGVVIIMESPDGATRVLVATAEHRRNTLTKVVIDPAVTMRNEGTIRFSDEAVRVHVDEGGVVRINSTR